MKPFVLRSGLAAALVAAAFGCGGAAQAEGWRANDDDALLLELHYRQYRIGDTLRGYQTPGGVCVDFADLIQALDLPLRLDKKSRRATGWLFAESQRLTIDREAFTVQNVNGEAKLSAGAIYDTPEGWCADTDALSNWFGVMLRPDLANLTLKLETDRKLPFLEAIERKSRAARLSRPDKTFDLAQLPQAELPYQAWRTPSVDVLVQAKWQNARFGAGGTQLQYTALASGEALGASLELRLASDGDGVPASLRVKAYRNDPTASMLGPLRATQLAAGDVQSYAGALTAQTAVGRGVFVTNRPLSRPSRFTATTLRGELPPGWDAELYRNGQLLGYQSGRADGRYEVPDVALLFGDNLLEVVLYGPQGQIRREKTEIPVGIESIPVGQTWYWAGALEVNRDLIDFRQHFTDPLTGWRWGVGVERGIDKRTTLGLEAQSLMLEGDRQTYLEATARRALGPMLLELSGAQQFGRGSGGRAYHALALGKFGRIRFEAETLWVDGEFFSEQVKRETRAQLGLRLATEFKLGRWRLPVQAEARQTLAKSGEKVTEWLTRGSLSLNRLAFTAELNSRQTAGPGLHDDDGTRLQLLANTLIGKLRLRGDTTFKLSGANQGFEAARLDGELRLGERSELRAGFDYDRPSKLGRFELGYVHHFDRFALRGEATADTRGGVGVGLSFAFSLGPDPVDGGWRMKRDKLAAFGEAAVLVYRDDNGDGRRQPGEEPVEGVALEAGFLHSDKPTNAKGLAVIDGLRPFTPVVVAIDAASLEDPLLLPKGEGVVVVPRPGIAARIELGLTPTGEIEGTLLGVDGEPREGATLELVDPRGRVAARTVSEFDGYFLFDSVPYGDYRLRLAPASAAALRAAGELGVALKLGRESASARLGKVRIAANPAPPAKLATAP
ncbi:MAG: MSCRAMM family protein [Novosphingobium sp.]